MGEGKERNRKVYVIYLEMNKHEHICVIYRNISVLVENILV